MPSFKSLPPEEKKTYLVVTLGVASMGFGMVADAFPSLSAFLFPLAVVCAVGFAAAFAGPSEKLFPLRTLLLRASPTLWAWMVYILKALLFFGGISAVLYFVFRAVRMLM